MLGDTEQGYNTNEKELLAIVRALRNYLYEVAVLTIYTDQSLIYSISDKKSNSKLEMEKLNRRIRSKISLQTGPSKCCSMHFFDNRNNEKSKTAIELVQKPNSFYKK